MGHAVVLATSRRVSQNLYSPETEQFHCHNTLSGERLSRYCYGGRSCRLAAVYTLFPPRANRRPLDSPIHRGCIGVIRLPQGFRSCRRLSLSRRKNFRHNADSRPTVKLSFSFEFKEALDRAGGWGYRSRTCGIQFQAGALPVELIPGSWHNGPTGCYRYGIRTRVCSNELPLYLLS